VSSGSYDAPPLRSLADFKRTGYDKGRPYIAQAAWFAIENLVFSEWRLLQALRPILLRLFRVEVGNNAFIRHRVRVLWTSRLIIGDNCWIGEDAWILNLEPVCIGHDVGVPHDAFLSTGSQDMASPSLEYDNALVSSNSKFTPGATAPRRSVVAMGAVTAGEHPPERLVARLPATVRHRVCGHYFNRTRQEVDLPDEVAR
jgi:putative colanic acid biosynthesis acetyltransferase WcaF